MITMGMISRYNDENGMGTLVLSDGEIREFTKEDWIDKEFEPSMGQKVLYKIEQNTKEIRTTTDEEIKELKENQQKEEKSIEKPKEESLSSHQFSSVEESIEHYQNLGFKLASDRDIKGIRTISMRYYENGEFGEAVISVDGSPFEISETRNGKPV